MKNRTVFISGTVVLSVVVLGYAGWRLRLRDLPEAIEDGDLGAADALADELFEVGELGREVRVLASLLTFCLVGMILTSRYAGSAAVAEPFKIGFHPS
jgi:hypothetical protein